MATIFGAKRVIQLLILLFFKKFLICRVKTEELGLVSWWQFAFWEEKNYFKF